MVLNGFCFHFATAFPDLVVTFDSIEEVKPGVVVVKNFASRGTHKAPYAFGSFPPVPATNRVVDEEGCQITFKMSRGKVTKFQVDIEGDDLVGPPGYYFRVGGRMNATPEEEASVSTTSASTRTQ